MKEDPSRNLLQNEFEKRRSRNPSYSLRAFSRDLGIGNTSLSDCLANKRSLSKTNKIKVAEALGLSPKEIDQLLQKRSVKSTEKPEAERLFIEEDKFQLVANWYYLAILNLAKIKDSKNDAAWMAERLGIDELDARTALERLIRLEFLRVEDEKLIRTAKPISTTKDVPSRAIQKYHLDHCGLAEKALLSVDISKRDFSSVTMAIDPEKIPMAKEILTKSLRKVSKVLENSNPEEVYTLSFQLYPLTK